MVGVPWSSTLCITLSHVFSFVLLGAGRRKAEISGLVQHRFEQDQTSDLPNQHNCDLKRYDSAEEALKRRWRR